MKKPFEWSKATEQAARLVADDKLSDEAIARKCGIVRQTLARWKARPEFGARVAEHREAAHKASIGVSIAERRARLLALQDRHDRMNRVIQERAADPDMIAVPGGGTGLLVRKFKQIGSGKEAKVVSEYEVDTGLLREAREHEKQAAQETGQWHETAPAEDDGSCTLEEFARIYHLLTRTPRTAAKET